MNSNGIIQIQLIRIGQRGIRKKCSSWIPAAKTVFFYSMVDQLKGQEASPTSHLGWLQAGWGFFMHSTINMRFYPIHITSITCPCRTDKPNKRLDNQKVYDVLTSKYIQQCKACWR